MENDMRPVESHTEVKPQTKSMWPVLVGLAAAVLAPGLELATGHPLPYLLVLTLLAGIVWGAWRLGRKGMGLRLGTTRSHLVALSYPILALSTLALLAMFFGSIAVQAFSVQAVLGKLGLMFISTWFGVLITEEGFFRGALWGLSERAHWQKSRVLLWTSLAFMAWHVAVPLIEEDFALPARQIPLYYCNVVLLGLSWGLLRMISGSVLVSCTAHASWNAIVYVLFGYGLKTGSLGIARITLFDPERGLLGLVINAVIAYLLYRWFRSERGNNS